MVAAAVAQGLRPETLDLAREVRADVDGGVELTVRENGQVLVAVREQVLRVRQLVDRRLAAMQHRHLVAGVERPPGPLPRPTNLVPPMKSMRMG